MTTWLLNLWDRLRNSLWFVPAVGLLIAIGVAISMLELDQELRVERIPELSALTTTAPAARATLSSLAGALVTVTGVVFSITMLTLAQTSTQFGSRLLRSFLNHNATQFTLAVFLATSLYCFMVLRTIREVGDGKLFVPHLSVAVGLFGGLVCLAAFIYFIHHVSSSIQAQQVVRNVAWELFDAIDRLFPQELGSTSDDPSDEAPPFCEDDVTAEVLSTSIGYIQAVDGDAMIRLAAENDLVIRLERRPGDFIATGTVIALVCPSRQDDESLEALRRCFLTGTRRTPRQDVVCAIRELTEVAVRALSPGINDPHTAVSCIDYLGAALMRLAQRELPSPVRRDENCQVRVIVNPVSFGDTLNAAFDEIRQHGRTNESVMVRLAETLAIVSRHVSRGADIDALLHHLEMVNTLCRGGRSEFDDPSVIRNSVEGARQHLTRKASLLSQQSSQARAAGPADIAHSQ